MCLFGQYLGCELFNGAEEQQFKSNDFLTNELVWAAASSKSPNGQNIWRTGGFYSKESQDYFESLVRRRTVVGPSAITNRIWILNLRPFYWYEGNKKIKNGYDMANE